MPGVQDGDTDVPATERDPAAPSGTGSKSKGQRKRKPKAQQQRDASAGEESDFAEPSKFVENEGPEETPSREVGFGPARTEDGTSLPNHQSRRRTPP